MQFITKIAHNLLIYIQVHAGCLYFGWKFIGTSKLVNMPDCENPICTMHCQILDSCKIRSNQFKTKYD